MIRVGLAGYGLAGSVFHAPLIRACDRMELTAVLTSRDAPARVGTLDELLEQLTWSQLGLHGKPVGLLDVEDYWLPLIALARHASAEGFVREADLGAIAVAADAEGLLDRLERLTREPRPRPKWSRPIEP